MACLALCGRGRHHTTDVKNINTNGEVCSVPGREGVRGGGKEPSRGQERGRTADPSDATGPDQEGFREEVAVAEPAGVTYPGRACS